MDPLRSSLCPGYKHVTSFSPSLSSPNSKESPPADREVNVSSPENEHAGEEADYEEEVEYVVLDLGNIEPTLVPSSSTYRLIGLDTPTPFLQLSGTVLRGRHENLLGSELIFTDDKDSSTLTGPKKRGVTHVSTTSKRITFKEVQLRPKKKDSTPAPAYMMSSIERGAGPEEGHLEDADDTMDVDDALEYVDISIDPVLRESEPQPQAGPSYSTPPSAPSPISTPSLCSASPSFSSFSSFISLTPEKEKLLENSSPIADVEEVPSDPTLRIDRLTGTSSPLTRASRGPKKAAVTSSVATGSETRSKTTVKGKQKQKATVDMSANGNRMDTRED